MIKRSAEDRFWAKVEKTDTCWLWRACVDGKGYGMFRPRGRRGAARAHRFAWEIATGEMPKLDVLHRCDNPSCVRFDHLFLGTQADNNADRDAKGRHRFVISLGEAHGQAKLTARDIPVIRRLRIAGASFQKIADRFGVSSNTVRDVTLGITWSHVQC